MTKYPQYQRPGQDQASSYRVLRTNWWNVDFVRVLRMVSKAVFVRATLFFLGGVECPSVVRHSPTEHLFTVYTFD